MAFQSSSSSGSQSPASSSVSPSSHTIPLIYSSEDNDNSSRRGTPNRYSIDLPRNQVASKGGCWTCRLRRKKCDEEREGDSCRTCIRLTIDCLGWGPKRPEWMRDKQAVEAYKANIKAQLTRAGLIRGQPRSSLIIPSQRPQPMHRLSAPAESTTPLSYDSPNAEFAFQYTPQIRHNVFSGASNSAFHQLPGASYSDPSINTVDFGTTFFHYSPQSSTPVSTGSAPHGADLNDFDLSQIGAGNHNSGFEYEVRAPSPAPNFPLFAGQNSLQESHVIYYFEHVRKLQYIFAGNAVTNITCSLIVQEPRGPVTNAVCALANLHFTRMQVAQGLEAPDPNPEHSTAKYFHDEAYMQLANAKHVRGHYSESDAIAALHLVWFSQLSGGATNWQLVFDIACDWVVHTNLPTDDNPRVKLNSLSATGQLIVKLTLWLDVFSSLTLLRPPKFIALYRELFSEQGAYWAGPLPADLEKGLLRMEILTGCPNEALLGIAEVSALAQWKTSEKRKGTLSVRELVRRGDEIEQRLRQSHPDVPNYNEVDPLHPNLSSTESTANAPVFPSDEVRRLVAKIFRESVMLYLHTILSDPIPGVHDISSSVETIVQLLSQLPASEIDRALVFPICLAGCMTDDSRRRDFLKSRLQALDEGIGNLMRTRLLMEAVWQKRDVSGATVDWRETMRERGLNLLLV